MYCNHCGSEAEDGNTFCLDCGLEISSDVYCASCDQLAEDGDVFCYWCGDKLPELINTNTTASSVHSKASKSRIRCKNCGEYLEPNAVFCEECGQNVRGSSVQTKNTNVATTVAPAFAPSPQVQKKPIAPTPPARKPQSRMPLIFLIDASASTRPYIDELNTCLNQFKADVCKDKRVLDILDVAILQFNNNIHVLQELIPVGNMKPVRLITAGQSAYTPPIKEALRILNDFNKQNSNAYRPWVILLSGSSAIDDVTSIADTVRQKSSNLRFIALGVPGYNSATLKRITDAVFRLDGIDFTHFFRWIVESMWAIADTSPGEKVNYPQLQGNVSRDA